MRNNRHIYQLIFFLLLWGQFCICQTIEGQLDSYLKSFDTEKIYVHHDRSSYMQGDTIWCKVYLLDGLFHEPVLEQTIVYAEWYNPGGEMLEAFNLRSEQGRAMVDIPIDPNANTGEYTLKVYTLYQLNFDKEFLFQKKIKVTGYEDELVQEESSNEFEIQFFPEGGYLVDGLESRVGFKAVDGDGKSIEVDGKVYDEGGGLLTAFKTLHEGSGFFSIIPKHDQEYRIIVDFGNQQKTTKLPDVLKKGYVLNISSTSKEHIKLIIHANAKVDLEDCFVVGYQKGELFMDQKLGNKNAVVMNLEKSALPHGLLHFTLFDKHNRPVSERLIYNTANAEEVNVDLRVDSELLGTKRRNKAIISSDEFSNSYKANLSVSVYNLRYTEGVPAYGLNIKNYLNLQSELKGKIMNINQYFLEDDAKTRALLDLLLMTHGWSRFTWQEVLSEESKEINFPRESVFSLSGQILKAKKDKPVKADVLINVLDQGDFSINNIETGEDGIFHVADLGIQDSTNIFIQANIYNKKKKGKSNKDELGKSGDSDVDIKLIELKEHKYDPVFSIPISEVNTELAAEKEVEVKEVINAKLGLENIDSSLWSLSIDEVTVKGKKINQRRQRKIDTKRKYRERKMFYLGNTDKFYAEDLYKYQGEFKDVFDMIATAVPGSTATGSPGNRQIGTRNGGGIPIALNDELVSAHYLDFIDPEQIELIEVITGDFADLLFGYGFVIRVVTKTDNPLLDAKIADMTKGTLNISHPGFYKAKEYYKIMYEDDVYTSAPDERVTLYWNPDIELKGEPIEIEFSTSNLGGEHMIRVEGISEDGIPIVVDKTFYVESEKP